MRIAIIGAGIAGLTAARRLAAAHEVVLFDKSRGVGGRMSTRYAGDYEFDHGAQYFTITDPDFRSLIEPLQADAHRWDSRAVYLKSGTLVPDTGKPRWVGQSRMNSVPKALAEGLTVRLGRRVSQITGSAGSISLHFEDGSKEGPFDYVVSTAPAPQSAAMLPADSPLQTPLAGVQMHACFALMVGLESALKLEWDSLRVNDLPVSWIAHNATKPGRPAGVSTLVIHSAPEWSDANKDAGRDWVQAQLLECASMLCAQDLSVAPHIALHRWLYAYANEGVGQDCLFDEAAGIVLAGDWCVGGRVEGAFVSGRAAAATIQSAG